MSIFGGLIGGMGAIVAVGIALLSGLAHGYSGFGGALLMVPLLSLFIQPAHAIAATLVMAVAGQLSAVWRAVPSADWSECIPYLIGLILGLPAGTYLLVVTDANIIRKLVGLSTLMAAGVIAAGWVYRGQRTSTVSGSFGVLSGLIQGATGLGGPSAVAYFVASPVEAAVQRANIVAAVTGMLFTNLTFLFAAGFITLPVVAFGSMLSLPYLMGLWGGARMFVHLPKQHFRRAILLLLFVAGIIALTK